jgi:hypothetical protein
MARPSSYLDTSDKTLLQHHADVPIYIGNADGKIYALVGGIVVKKTTLAEIQRHITKKPDKGVPAIVVPYRVDQIQEGLEVTQHDKLGNPSWKLRFRLANGEFVDSDHTSSVWPASRHLYFHDEQVLSELKAILTEYQPLQTLGATSQQTFVRYSQRT